MLKSELESIEIEGVPLIVRDRHFREINAAAAFEKLYHEGHL
ncbi:hypothetical protein [Cesiribacter sp. SM1]|nr:hypothetical protein [Cesiribacter sp. SM1]